MERMTPRPIYRWKSFWLGLFVACFLAWAWRDSYRVGAGLSLEGRGRNHRWTGMDTDERQG
jgi:hypothetical protein